MERLHEALDSASALYADWFSGFLHMHFVLRTGILLLFLWGALFLLAQLFQYVFGPLLVLFYRHIIFRLYNYIFVETPYEIIYIKYFSKDKPNFRNLYLRLSDRVKNNRLLLSHTKYKGIIYKGTVKKATWVFVATVGVAFSLWLTAFGLHQEYAVPALVGYTPGDAAGDEINNDDELNNNLINNNNENNNIIYTPTGQAPGESDDIPLPSPTPPVSADVIYPSGIESPSGWVDGILLVLNIYGIEGARLRDEPGFTGTVIEMLWGERELEYLGYYRADAEVSGLYWLRVRSPENQIGYIANHLIERR